MSVTMSEELEGGGDSDETVIHDAYLNSNRFDVWAVNTGSHLNPSISSSLDHRLRNSNETRDKVILVLRAIRINLDYGGQHGGGHAKQQAPTSQEIASGLSNEALVSVHSFVSLLKRLSIAIKRASTDEYSVHAARARDVDKMGIDQGASDELWADQIVGVRFPDSPESLRKILSTAVSFRMRRFRDWKRHYERRKKRAITAVSQLATGAGRTTLTEGGPSGGSLDNKGKGVGAPAEDIHYGSAKPPDGVQESLAESKQSFQSANFEAPKSVSQSTTVSVGVRSMVAGVFIDWPNPPRGARNPDNGQVRCPYCFDLLDQREAGSKNKWRKHLTKDLEPYHCFDPECQTLLKMFPNEGQWVGHIRAFHSPGSWVCRMMPHTTAVMLDTEGAFRKHLEDEHAGMYPKSRIDTLAKGSYRPAVHANLFDECPMKCPASQASLESATERSALVPHIANHLLLLALESLPERSVRSSQVVSSDDDGDSEERMNSSLRRIRGTVQDGLESLPLFDSTDVGPVAEDTRDEGLPEAYYEDYSHIPMVEHQRRPLDTISQLKDPVMEKFFWIQKGIRVQTRRR
ncbi:hypothetical protein MAPG_05595 [Magnaporthiopsis poae ATCC 64411]|uniref:C2H2-type domain-containing protein n=1 Tax=Magnaporthiopsis poae (strain ATCC 64411 / 73-15) TaxID=644358 RepID=A0A0C4DZT8_MAGP6|nr:hypothetical protein MAPG_05595 [Magnaporthiopsis poae ATCC 64411]